MKDLTASEHLVLFDLISISHRTFLLQNLMLLSHRAFIVCFNARKPGKVYCLIYCLEIRYRLLFDLTLKSHNAFTV